MNALGQHDLVALMTHWMFPFLRVGGLILTAPVIGTRVVPSKVRLVLALAVSLTLIPVLPVAEQQALFSFQSLLIGVQQLTIGMLIGLVLRLTFVVVEVAGQIIAQQMGLGFASLVDPQTGLQVPVMSQFYITLATLIFLAFDGHLVMIAVLAESFVAIPVGDIGISGLALEMVLEWSSELFAGALAVALPTIVALLIVNIAFGIVTRAAPQLNIFAIGFPIIILFGVFVCYLTLDGLSLHMKLQFDMAFQLIRNIFLEVGNG